MLCRTCMGKSLDRFFFFSHLPAQTAPAKEGDILVDRRVPSCGEAKSQNFAREGERKKKKNAGVQFVSAERTTRCGRPVDRGDSHKADKCRARATRISRAFRRKRCFITQSRVSSHRCCFLQSLFSLVFSVDGSIGHFYTHAADQLLGSCHPACCWDAEEMQKVQHARKNAPSSRGEAWSMAWPNS